jgi:hypothetical protein
MEPFTHAIVNRIMLSPVERNGVKRVATGRDALPRDPAWHVNQGWITNGRGFNDGLIRVYSRFRFIGQVTPDRAGARPYQLQRASPLDPSALSTTH